MGSRKGQNNFRDAQTARTESSIALIESTLRKVPKGVVFRDKTSLLDYLSQEGQVSLHQTTLRRNTAYWTIILKYFIEQPGAAGIVNAYETNNAIMRVKELANAAEIKNLKNKVRRLKALAQSSGNPQTISASSSSEASNGAEAKRSPDDVRFASTAKALFVFITAIESLGVGITFDEKSGEIINSLDIDERRTLVSSSLLVDYAAWKAANAATLVHIK